MTMWVFGYGSLLWNPGFEVAERVVATLPGFTRCFCMRSVEYRGTREAPGLVLALDRQHDGACEGLALAVAAGHEADTLAYLRKRELITDAYDERIVNLKLVDGREVEAVTYVMNEGHAQYAGHLALEEQAEIIARASGASGPNTEYLFNTAAQLTEIGLHDPAIDWLARRVRAILA